MKLNKIALPVIAFATFGLVACGESGTTEQITNNYTTGMDFVASAADLPKCTADNAGEQYLVKADGEFYACNGKDWKALGGSGATASDYGCETESLADGSGVNILCNGEVIGTVLNGKDGAAGEQGVAGADGKDGEKGDVGEKGDKGEIGVGCKIVAQDESAVTIQCGDDKFSINLNGSNGESSEGEDITPVEGEDISIEIPELSGVSQKGPFIMGTEVKGYELDGTRAFAQTGRSFTGRIETNDGKFRINSVKLVSSQVLLSATGYYRDEVSGDQSKSPITLYAITDLTDRSNVNVNLLTHLEYDRVAKMMKESDGTLKIKTAKKNAQKEIFAAFGINATGFGYSEDLDIFGTDDQSAALLAISILLQGDRSEADLSGLLASFSKDIEEDGKWDDKATRGTIAKWAADMDNDKKYGVYRGYVTGWGLGSVPGFEKYLRNFWSREYGLGVCGSDTVPVGTVKNATNNNGEASKDYAASYTSQTNKKRFICVDADSLKWRVATDIEKDTMGLEHGAATTHEQASVINGLVNTDYVYVYEDNQYRRGTALDKSLGLNGCTVARKDTVAKSGTNWYKCESQAWRIATDIEKDTAGWGHDFKTGDVRNGRVNTNLVYVYEDDNWRHGTAVDSLMFKQKADGGKACTKGSLNDTSAVKANGLYYVCVAGVADTSYRWVKALDFYNDTYEARSECSATGLYSDGTILNGRVNSSNKYVCDDDKFRLVNTFEKTINRGCVSYMVEQNVIYNQEISDYICSSDGWIIYKESITYDGQTYKIVRIGTQTWFAENLNFDPGNVSTLSSVAWHGCYNNEQENCNKYGRLYTWDVAMKDNACAYNKLCKPTGKQQGICPDGWHLPNHSEWSTLRDVVGGASNAGSVLKSTSGWADNRNGSDSYGFSVYPAGKYHSNAGFSEMGSYGLFWSSTEDQSYSAISEIFYSHNSIADNFAHNKGYAYSVRCLKD